jgi:hypothetical protein
MLPYLPVTEKPTDGNQQVSLEFLIFRPVLIKNCNVSLNGSAVKLSHMPV